MKKITLIGAGGHGKVVADTAEACGYDHIHFVDHAWPERQTNGRWAVTGVPEPDMPRPVFCAIGKNNIRAKLFESFDLSDSPALRHPTAIISPSVRLGAGTLAVAGCIINADALIGRGVILNTGCSVDHDCCLEDFVHISPGVRLAGGVRVGARSWIGIGAVVREGVQIGADVMVAAGAVVVRDIPDGIRVAGMPAKPL